MPVNQDRTWEDFDGNGSTQVPYPISLERDNDADLKLLVAGSEYTNFTVSEDGFRTGTAVSPGTPVILYRETPLLQSNPYPRNITPPPEDVRQNVDKLTLIVQEIVARTIRTSVGSSAPKGGLEAAPNTTIGQNADGTLVSRTPTEELAHLGVLSRLETIEQRLNDLVLPVTPTTTLSALEALIRSVVLESSGSYKDYLSPADIPDNHIGRSGGKLYSKDQDSDQPDLLRDQS